MFRYSLPVYTCGVSDISLMCFARFLYKYGRSELYILYDGYRRGCIYRLERLWGSCLPPPHYKTQTSHGRHGILFLFFLPTVTNSNIFVTMYNTHGRKLYRQIFSWSVPNSAEPVYIHIMYIYTPIRAHNIYTIDKWHTCKCYSGPWSHRKCIIIFPVWARA